MGVIPDYLYDGKGMRIDGVSEGKPAQKAGLQKGDVVVQMGDSTVPVGNEHVMPDCWGVVPGFHFPGSPA